MCSAEGCDRPVHAKGLCSKHYDRMRRYGRLNLVRTGQPARCSVEGCERWSRSKGLCSAHYTRFWKYGDPGPVEVLQFQERAGECAICGKEPVYALGWCVHHYENNRLRGDPLAEGPGRGKRPSKWGPTCVVDGCERPRGRARGLCPMHYERLRKHGTVGTPEPHRSENGNGRHVNKHGYVVLTNPKGGRQVLEHRLVMEQILGRELLPNEMVHHKNGVRDDNRPENLELCVKFQPPGQRAEDLVQFAQNILSLYEPKGS